MAYSPVIDADYRPERVRLSTPHRSELRVRMFEIQIKQILTRLFKKKCGIKIRASKELTSNDRG